MSGRGLGVLGGGGHARVVIDAVRAGRALGAHDDEVVAVFDDDPVRTGGDVLGVPVLGRLDAMGPGLGVDGFVLGIGSAGDARHRARLFDAAAGRGVGAIGVVHPSATVSSGAVLGAGSVVLAGAIVQVGARVAVNVIVNTRAVVEHDATIGAHSHVSPGAVVLGGAQIGEACHVGAGAVVLQGVSIGDGAVIGAGAVVTGDVARRAVVVGVPARVVRTLDA